MTQQMLSSANAAILIKLSKLMSGINNYKVNQMLPLFKIQKELCRLINSAF